MEVHVIELAPRLMALQLDDAGGAVLRKRIEELGVVVHTATASREIVGGDGRVRALLLRGRQRAGGRRRGVLGRHPPARRAGARRRPDRGRARRHRRSISAAAPATRRSTPIGECASYEGRCYGLVAPGYQMARAALADLCGGDDVVHRLRHEHEAEAARRRRRQLRRRVRRARRRARRQHPRHQRRAFTRSWCCRPIASTCWAACWSATPSAYGELLQIAQNQIVLPPAPEALILPARRRQAGRRRRRRAARRARRSARATTSARARSAAPSASRS